VTTTVTQAWGSCYRCADQALPAKPSGATVTHVTVMDGGNVNFWASSSLNPWACAIIRPDNYPTNTSYPVVVVCYGTKP